MHLARSRAAILALTLTLTSAEPLASAPLRVTRADAAAIDQIVESSRKELHLPGVSLAIMQGDRMLLARGYGVADLQTKQPPTTETIYPIGSLSKQFTAAAIMKLVQQHRVQLTRPVTYYLPEYRSPDDPIPTIEQLLSQTTGIPTWDDLPELQDESNLDHFALPQLVQTLSQHRSAYRAGDWWSYSNSNYMLLARVVERVTDRPLGQYLAETFFKPLRLSATSECLTLPPETGTKLGFAAGYEFSDAAFAPRPMRKASQIGMAGAGGLCSNATDLLRWTRALVKGEAIGTAAYRRMIKPTPVRSGFTAPYGFGLSRLPFANQKAVWHTGVMAGYLSVLVYLPDHDITMVALTNSRHVPLNTMLKRIAENILNIQPPRVRDLGVPESELRRVVGDYDDHMFKLRIYRAGSHLFADVPPLGSPQELFYQGDHQFMTKGPRSFRFSFVPANGPVTRLDWEWTELRAYAQPVH